ncbi:MAG: hypothetical protein ACO1OB_02510 [Archangium sp.]
MWRSLVLVSLLMSCGPGADGSVRFSVWAEERVERGYPASLLADRWAITFDRYLVSLGEVTLSNESGSHTASRRVVVDVQKGRQPSHAFDAIPAGRWNVGFVVEPPGDGAETGDTVTQADVDTMRSEGWSYWLQGRATKTGVGSYEFSIGFPVTGRGTECTNGVDGTLGIIVGDGRQTDAELTIHAEHMLYDRLGTHRDVQLRFEAWTVDGDITRATLQRQKLLSLQSADGGVLLDERGAPVVYQPGSYAVDTLDAFVIQSLKDQVHLNGGGLCRVQ